MRNPIAVASALTLLVTPAFARVAPSMPAAMEEAPVSRAIENVAQDRDLAPAQRERLLGRLHLIAYAQGRPHLTRWSNGEWQPEGVAPCGDAAYAVEGRQQLCPFGHRGLGTRELPMEQHRNPWSFTMVDHLNQSRVHYQRALDLDGSNLRAHVGMAYVLDELNRDEEARAHLRQVLTLVEPLFRDGARGEYLDWEDHVVTGEALEHLKVLARSRADRDRVSSFDHRYSVARPSGWVTPIVVSIEDASFDALVDIASPVSFDFAGTGDARARGWLTPSAAWLVWDPNRRGDIQSGFDLLGQRTWAVFWRDGFEAMRSLDDNRDGELAGSELGGLALWRDANSNGVSEAGEVAPVSDFGVVALSVFGAEERPGLLAAPAGVRFENGVTRPLYDWTPGYGREPTS